MAGEELHNWLQERVDDLRELLEPIAMAVNDEAARREILAAVGLDPAQASQPLVVPPTALASIDAYRQRAPADADLQAFVSLVQDITQVVQAVIDLLGMAAANDPNAPPGFAAEQAVGALLSSLALGAIRVEQPGVYATIKALQLVEEQGVRFGGVVQLVFRTGEFFTELWGAASRLETDADAKRVSDVALFITGALLTGFLEGDYVYGYDAGPGSPSPLADAASNRTLTMRFSGTTKDQAGNTAKGSLTMGAVLVPAELGGAGLLMRLLAEGSLEVPFGDEKKKEKSLILRITASAPDLIFFIGGGDYQFPATTDASVGARLEYRSTKETPVIWGDPGGIHLRVGKLGLEGKVSTTDHLIKGEIRDSAFVLATKSADGFLKTVLDALVPNGKLETTFAFELGYSKKRGAFVGGGTPDRRSRALSRWARRRSQVAHGYAEANHMTSPEAASRRFTPDDFNYTLPEDRIAQRDP
jgi:hypothetical protein